MRIIKQQSYSFPSVERWVVVSDDGLSSANYSTQKEAEEAAGELYKPFDRSAGVQTSLPVEVGPGGPVKP